MSKIFRAHITEVDGRKIYQTVTEHSENTAIYASQKLSAIGLSETGKFVGLIHDMGKTKREFDEYLEDENAVRGSVNHTFAACKYLLRKYHDDSPLVCEILAAAIGSHHGLFDAVDPEQQNGFLHRLNKDDDDISYDESVENFLSQCVDAQELDRLFYASVKEIMAVLEKFKSTAAKNQSLCFGIGLLVRMITSALVDADRRDTAEFMEQNKRTFTEADKDFWSEQLDFFEEKYQSGIKANAKDTPINRARSFISDKAKQKASCSSAGIYSLNVPTGGGKTLSTLRFALENAKAFGKKRIIFAIPLLSIIDQNAKEIKAFVKDGERNVLIHHSNIVNDKESANEANRYELLTEAWEAPVIVTTLVQLLNTLFSGKMSCVRRMNALCDSVIVIDEVQSVPKKLIYMFNTALNFLAYASGATIVLSSATQPCFENVGYPLRLAENCDIIEADEKLFSVFNRVKIEDRIDPHGITLDELGDFANEIISASSSLLVILNTKKTATELYRKLACQNVDAEVFCLTTNMCLAHRRKTLDRINELLEESRSGGKKVLCVATQLVEAGVDFSFESLIRIEAGLENIAQAAGRCNRSGEYGKLCSTYIVRLKDENLNYLKEIKTSQDALSEFLVKYKTNSECFKNDFLSEQSIACYYSCLFKEYEQAANVFEYPIENGVTVFDLLAQNTAFNKRRAEGYGEFYVNQAFKTAGRKFEVFDNPAVDVLVPYNDGARQIICDLGSKKAENDFRFLKETLKKARPYTVSIYENQLKKVGIKKLADGKITVLNDGYYDSVTGFNTQINNEKEGLLCI